MKRQQTLGELRIFARSAAGFKQSQVFWQRRLDGQWLAAEALPFSDPRWRDSDPHLSRDGKTLTFVSDRPVTGDQPLGQLDIFESKWAMGQWSPPQRLSEAVQSRAYELGPERYADELYFASYRKGGPGKLSVYLSERLASGEHSPALALPAPINIGPSNSDFTLSPDGRYALWWSDRQEESTKLANEGDLFIAERLGAGFGPAIRLPAPINTVSFEFTPSVSSDGRWLMFASTRPGPHSAGLSQLYRVSWPDLLSKLAPQIESASQAQLEQRLSHLWQGIGHAAGVASDIELLRPLLHPQARIWGQGLRGASLHLNSWSGSEFLDMMKAPSSDALLECEVHRELRRYGAHAQVYSVVESRRRADQAEADYTGVNSSQWQLGPQGWQLLSLHYALALPGQVPPEKSSLSGQCVS
ncbi:hypothetical protein ACFQNF_09805 [Iodobacter arcticus]|uniref:Uncharacterized protein n=1 Tax=Iodobacter arcticus TaxID=590593 RepID=A0ABW2QX68_9NEIS